MARKTQVFVAALGLFTFGASVSAAPESDPAEALKPRYAIEATRLSAVPSRDSSDGRYRLDARLRPAESQQTGNGMTLNAKLVAATTTGCDAGVIFANGFE